MKEFFHMGGYALYVWPSYGLAMIILIANLVAPVLQRRRLLADIARKLRRARRDQ
jgi:heme exporter protein D